MSQLPNYAAEGRIKAVCAENGVLADCLDDIALQFREGKLSEAELPAKIKEWKATPDHHYFHRGEGDDKELFVRAFGESPSLQAKGEVFKKYGAARAAEVAAQFGNTITGLKAGKTPDSFKTNGNGGDHSANPFTRLRVNGKINEAAAAEVAKMTKALGTKKVEAIARAAGMTITGLPLRA